MPAFCSICHTPVTVLVSPATRRRRAVSAGIATVETVKAKRSSSASDATRA